MKKGQKRIEIVMDAKTINDFRGHLGEEGTNATTKLKKWIKDYVDIRNERDIVSIEEKKILTEEKPMV